MLKALIVIVTFVLYSFPAHAQSSSWSNGGAASHYLSAASTNSTLVSSGKRNIMNVVATNTTATTYYLKLYDKATAPTCGTDTPIQTYPIAAGQTTPLVSPNGIAVVSGVGFCLTGALPDADATSAATGVAINFVYK
jgi:hypothetical protein